MTRLQDKAAELLVRLTFLYFPQLLFGTLRPQPRTCRQSSRGAPPVQHPIVIGPLNSLSPLLIEDGAGSVAAPPGATTAARKRGITPFLWYADGSLLLYNKTEDGYVERSRDRIPQIYFKNMKFKSNYDTGNFYIPSRETLEKTLCNRYHYEAEPVRLDTRHWPNTEGKYPGRQK